MRKLTLILSVLFLLIASPTFAETYWCDDDGSQTNVTNCDGVSPLSGSSACTLATIMNYESFTGGDIIYFRTSEWSGNGTDYNEPRWYPGSSGSSWASQVIYKAYEDEVVQFTQTGVNPVFGIWDTDYVTIDGFTFNARAAAIEAGTVNIHASSGALIGNKIINCFFEGATGGNNDRRVLLDLQDMRGVLIQNNIFRNMRWSTGDRTNVAALQTYNVQDSDSPAIDFVIEKNTFNNNESGIQYKSGGLNANQCWNVKIRYNLFYDHVAGYSDIVIGYDSRDGEIYQNIIIDGGIFKGGNVREGSPNMKIYNNTFIGDVYWDDTSDYAWHFHYYNNATDDWEWYNNLHVSKHSNTRVVVWDGTGNNWANFDYNLYWYYGIGSYTPTYIYEGTTRDWTWWRANIGDTNSTYTTDPEFINLTGDENGDYHLSGGSGALTASDVSGPVGAYITGNEQIGYSAGGEPDEDPPTPNPMTWASEPGEDSPTQISMESTTGSDPSTPIEYYFDYDQGNSGCGSDGGTGGTDSGWQSADVTYSDSGLQANKCYGYKVRARDAIPNTGTFSAVSADYTAANTPGAPILSNATLTTLDIQNDANGNPTANPGTTYAIQVVTTSPADATWLNKWIDASGDPQAAEVWLSDATWDAITLQGLTLATTYGAKSKARNGDNTATPLSVEGQYTTTSGFTPPMHGASGSGLNVAP